MFSIQDDQIKKLERDLKTFANQALPYATRKTLNDTAFQAQKIARADIRRKMITRNNFTMQSIRVNQARSPDVKRQSASVGSTADYMEDQEFGATKVKRGKEGVAIPTAWSAGQGENAQPRTRLPRKPNRMASIQLQKRRKLKGSNRKQQNFVAVKQAAQSGRKYLFMDLGRRKGIFKVTGTQRRPKVKMVHDMTKPSVVIPKNPWLKPAFDESVGMLPAFYADALRFQLRRRGLFR